MLSLSWAHTEGLLDRLESLSVWDRGDAPGVQREEELRWYSLRPPIHSPSCSTGRAERWGYNSNCLPAERELSEDKLRIIRLSILTEVNRSGLTAVTLFAFHSTFQHVLLQMFHGDGLTYELRMHALKHFK